ncbi:MAG: YvrJ family protein [Peptoniphilus sp.]|uniref:YvrJ family protein n=1 Tax=Peptoniphilus sp. TaxID=1971214 RepID=UPI002A7486BF|nr:YvrJ family protein [Peptoniphilus sp.]MDY2987468.1 YvrJ family protein [Peptoniphilus sp.]
MDEIMTQISNVGFPIAITFYLLFRIESKLNDLTNSIHELSNSIVNLNDNK